MEIQDAKRYGILAKSYPEADVPNFGSYDEALAWFNKVTIPTYVAMVRAEVSDKGVALTERQVIALASFAHNLGLGNLRMLVDGTHPAHGPEGGGDRLLQGNRDYLPAKILEFRKAGGVVREGLIKRRYWEKDLLT